ncbi:flippase-like domain-containing protein [Vicingus serpentipes]|uniref:Flippase-like domain-containing protein n=1 Tax=Vicingus serpentipes TaxID=1926625 RepID=A0A5C6RQP2_9FLAO|nr:lysylphosphatidylglycerol synthase transmembrane domain-containing protein [Vicingus serpentipes]TXB64661.1 flippase-like domain-containing protein [Vicingus serpentipes]
MKKGLIAALKIIIPLGIGVYLTWFFISNLTDVELQNLKNAFLKADYRFIFIGIIIMLLSHMSRAYRWKYLLAPLGHTPNFWKMYHSVMIGYLINLTIPRSGEVARAGYYAKFQKKAPFEKVFGTIIVERIIDVIMLGIVMGITLYFQKDVEAFNSIKNTGNSGGGIPTWGYFLAALLIVVGFVLIMSVPKIKLKVREILRGLYEGVSTILQLKQRTAYVLHTIFIWVCYVLMLWVCSFALPETANLSINAVFAAFVVGGIAISATPGGIGLYPLMVAAVLSNLYNIENAESFSMLAWTSLTAFTILAGLVSLVALPFISKKQAALSE